MYETKYIQHRITSGYITVVANSHSVPAFWAHPVAGGIFPGLVMLHSAAGMTATARTFVRRLAEVGFYVIAPEMMAGNVSMAPEALRAVGSLYVDAVLAVLKTHNHCNGQIGVVGWEAGGELAYLAAMERSDLGAAVVFCGKPDEFIARIPTDDTPLLAFYGDADPDISPATLNQLSQAMAISPVKTQLVVYPDVTNRFIDAESPLYHAHYAADAWSKCLDFLCDTLGIPQKGGGRKRATRD